jgi:flagellar biosynthesis/type III secretory pathway chaperone
VALLQTTLIAPKSDAADALISAAYERRNEAEAEVNEAMQTLDPTNQADGQLIEQAFAKIQSANQVVADAQMRSSEQGPLVSPERR